MTLTKEQLRVIDSCPVLSQLKDWFIATAALESEESDYDYAFYSYDTPEGERVMGEGGLNLTGVTSGDYTQVEIVETTDSNLVVGQTFYVPTACIPIASNVGALGLCQLSPQNEDDGSLMETPIYVMIIPPNEHPSEFTVEPNEDDEGLTPIASPDNP